MLLRRTTRFLGRDEFYHFLSCTLGQRIPISQVIYFNVLDVIAVGNVHLAVEGGGRRGA